MSGARVVVVGASGLVGREILSLLAERRFPVEEIFPFASDRSEGGELEMGDEVLRVRRLPRELPAADVVFLCATPEVSREVAEDAAAEGAFVIDLTGAFHADPGVCRAWAGVPSRGAAGGQVVSVPGPPALVLAAVLRPALSLGLRRVVTTALVSASTFGDDAVGALARSSARLLGGVALEEGGEPGADEAYAFNCRSVPDGEAGIERARIAAETREILGLGEDVAISVHVVRTPTFHGQGLMVSAEVSRPVDRAALDAALREAPSLLLTGPSGTRDAIGGEAIHVTSPRVDPSDPRWFHLWAASDNVRQGAALNAVALAESRLRNRPGRG